MGEGVSVNVFPGQKILIFPERLRVFLWNIGNINNILIQNIFSALSLKHKAYVDDQIAISQYHS